MKEKYGLRAEFGPETLFAVRTAGPPFRATEESAFESLKRSLLWEELEDAVGADMNARLRRAANEAAALAWTTTVPLLFFPALFEEKARLAVSQAAKQEAIHTRSRKALAA